jgi:hypothetical protein
MVDRGPEKEATPQEILGHMKSYDRPVWTASSLADELGVSRPTIGDRLEEVEEDPCVRTMQVGNTKAYYVSEEDPRPLEEQHKDSIIGEFTDKFVGLPTAPWTAVHPNDGPAEAGDKVQIRVEGVPGRWRQQMIYTWDRRREELIYEETTSGETQALIKGELYAKPTTPIEHTDYPDDYDLELNIGGEYQEVEGRSRPILLVAGVKNYLVNPCDNAVFLKNVSVDWMSPKRHGREQEVGTYEVTKEMIERAEARDTAVDAREEHQHADSPEDVEAEQPGIEFVERVLDAREPGESWLISIINLGVISLDEDAVELLVEHPNSPVDSEEELRALVDEWGGEEDEQ